MNIFSKISSLCLVLCCLMFPSVSVGQDAGDDLLLMVLPAILTGAILDQNPLYPVSRDPKDYFVLNPGQPLPRTDFKGYLGLIDVTPFTPSVAPPTELPPCYVGSQAPCVSCVSPFGGGVQPVIPKPPFNCVLN